MKIKILIPIFVFLALISLVSAIDIDSCTELNSADTMYVLNTSVVGSGVCMNITASNVTLDCQGNTISNSTIYSTGTGVIKNCVVTGVMGVDIPSDGDYYGLPGEEIVGIYVSGNTQVYNNTIYDLIGGLGQDEVGNHGTGYSGLGGDAIGIKASGVNNNISGNLIYDLNGGSGGVCTGNYAYGGLGGGAFGIYLKDARDNFVISNEINTLVAGVGGNKTLGLAPTGAGGYTSAVALNNVTGSIIDNNNGTDFTGGRGGWALYYSAIPAAGGSAFIFYLENANNNSFINNNFGSLTEGIGSMINGTTGAVWFKDTNSYNNTLTDLSNLNYVDSDVILYFYTQSGLDVSGYSAASIFLQGGWDRGDGGDMTGLFLHTVTNSNFSDINISNYVGMPGGVGGYAQSGKLGGDGYGVYLLDSLGNTLDNLIVDDVKAGHGGTPNWNGRDGHGGDLKVVHIYNSDNNTLFNSEIMNSESGDGATLVDTRDDAGNAGNAYGVYLDSSDGNIISYVNFTSIYGGIGGRDGDRRRSGNGGRAIAIGLSTSNDNDVILNIMTTLIGGTGANHTWRGTGGVGGTAAGVHLSASTGNNISYNMMSGFIEGKGGWAPVDGVYKGSPIGPNGTVAGLWFEVDSFNNDISGNTFDEKQLIYRYAETGISINDSNVGSIAIGDQVFGIVLVDVNDSTIENNNISGLKGLPGVNGHEYLDGTDGKDVSAIYLKDSYNNNIKGSVLRNNKGGQGGAAGYAHYPGDGGDSIDILLEDSNYNNITENSIRPGKGIAGNGLHGTSYFAANGTGIGLEMKSSANNTIWDNFVNADIGVRVTGSVYSNDWNVTLQSSINIIGKNALGGNYWVSPNGTGFSETCLDSNYNYICDATNTFEANNIDYLPLFNTSQPPRIQEIYPLDGVLLYRIVSPNLSVQVMDFPDEGEIVNVTFYNASDDSIICSVNGLTSGVPGENASCQWMNLTPATTYYWYANRTGSGGVYTTGTLSFIPNDEPKAYNMRAELINGSVVLFKWQNEPDMEWISLKVGSDILELRELTGTEQNWTIDTLFGDSEYIFEWQIGDDLRAMSDYASFYFRSEGWKPDLTDYMYKRLVTVNSSLIGSDLNNYAVNVTLTEDNFQYFDSLNWVWYSAFRHLNWSNYNDIRIVDYYETTYLPFNVTKWDVSGEGCIAQQTFPNASNYTGSFASYPYAHDNNWLSQATSDPIGTDYYNYTIPAGAKSTSKFRIYDGAWGWDIDIPSVCFGGTDLEFKSEADVTIPRVLTYCENQGVPGTWALVRDNLNSSHYIYETMVTWEFDCEANILVKPLHYDDFTQSNVYGVDKDYDVKFWIYYGASGVTNNESTLNEAGVINGAEYLGSEVPYVAAAPVISNIDDTTGLTSTGTNISWQVDQITNNRVEYATNPYFLDSQWTWRVINVTELHEDVFGDYDTTILLGAFPDYWMGVVDVTCSNPAYSSNYTINSSATPVEITFHDVNNASYFNWTVTYTLNKTWDRNTGMPNFKLEGLTPNTKYYYRVWSYDGLNSSATGSFTLGTPPATPTAIIYNYTEDRPASQVTVCGDLTDMNSELEVNCSIQYWDGDDTTFSETSVTVMGSTGTFCNVINVVYGEDYLYRTKCQASTTGYSDAYSNEFMQIQEFFAGSFIDDDLDYRSRQYCPAGPAIPPCYEQTGYREGSNQEEDWIWVETNISDQGILKLHWYDGSWTEYNMTNDTDSSMQYLWLTGLGSTFQTFYITDQGDSMVLNWTKPAPTHLVNQNRTEESKYVSFDATPEPIDYLLMYLDYEDYNTSAMQFCLAAPGGNLYDCMAVEYFGGGRESGATEVLSGTDYDRGRLFRGGLTNGELYDTGLLGLTRDSDRGIGGPVGYNERFCFAYTAYWWNISLLPSNNITSYYYHYWSQNSRWSEYLGHPQTRLFDYTYVFAWEIDDLSYTRDWVAVDNSTNTIETIVLNATNETFNRTYDQSLLIGFESGFNADTAEDKIYDLGFYSDGRWNNQQMGLHQQAFVIFNLPDNATLQGMDSDSDGLNDYEELYTYYTNPKHNDTDEDGRLDGAEISIGYDPNLYTESDSVPSVSVAFNQTSYYSSDNVKANILFSDSDNDTGTVYVLWFVDSNSVVNQTFNNVDNGTVVEAMLGSGNFSRGEWVEVYVYAVAFGENSSIVQNSTVIQNTIPTTPDIAVNDVGGAFSIVCENSTDDDNDSLIYESEVYNINDTVIKKNWSGIMDYTGQVDDVGDALRIRCRSFDGINYSSYSEATTELGITIVETISCPSATPLESSIVNFTIYSNVSVTVGYNINVDVNMTYGGNTYTSSDCTYQNITSISRAYTCQVPFQYYYDPGSYDISVAATMVATGYTAVKSEVSYCTYNLLTATQRDREHVTFTSSYIGQDNVSVDIPIEVENTGNDEVVATVTAYDLIGSIIPSKKLEASYFRAGVNLTSSTQLEHGVPKNITFYLDNGQDSVLDFSLWLSAPTDLYPQPYLATTAWSLVLN